MQSDAAADWIKTKGCLDYPLRILWIIYCYRFFFFKGIIASQAKFKYHKTTFRQVCFLDVHLIYIKTQVPL